MVLPYQNWDIDKILHSIFSLFCPAAPKVAPAETDTSPHCHETQVVGEMGYVVPGKWDGIGSSFPGVMAQKDHWIKVFIEVYN